MRKLGHEVVVITSSIAPRIENEIGVIRTPDLFASRPLRRALRASPLPRSGEPPYGYSPPRTHERILVPDPKLLGWVPGALAAARNVLRRHPVDCLITTSPFESTHLIGLALARQCPWVADLRDGWTFESWRPALPSATQRRADAWLERHALTSADAVSAVPRAVAADVQRRLGRAAHHISDGWDPELERDLARASRTTLRPGRVRLVYTGTLWRADGQDPSPVFDALRRLRAEDHDLATRLELVLAGPLSPTESQRLSAFRLDGAVRHIGHVSRIEAVALQRAADALLLIGSSRRDVVTGKIFEYLASGQPIVVVPDENEAAAIVRDTGTGVAITLDHQTAIVQVLRDLITGKLRESYRPHGLEAFRYPAPARAMLDVVQEAITLGLARLAHR
jgi:glycosyltransferase involved in cell wall biosynthesis